jgi:hypothetical protein
MIQIGGFRCWLLLSVALTSCSSVKSHRLDIQPPEHAPSHEALLKAIPHEYFAGDVSGMNRTSSNLSPEYLEFLFLKNRREDRVPMRVAIYKQTVDGLVLQNSGPTPFSKDDCEDRTCIPRVSAAPNGFSISSLSQSDIHKEVTYTFILQKNDLLLTETFFGVHTNPMADYSIEGSCSISNHYGKMTRTPLEAAGKFPQFLFKDSIKFSNKEFLTICKP